MAEPLVDPKAKDDEDIFIELTKEQIYAKYNNAISKLNDAIVDLAPLNSAFAIRLRKTYSYYTYLLTKEASRDANF